MSSQLSKLRQKRVRQARLLLTLAGKHSAALEELLTAASSGALSLDAFAQTTTVEELDAAHVAWSSAFREITDLHALPDDWRKRTPTGRPQAAPTKPPTKPLARCMAILTKTMPSAKKDEIDAAARAVIADERKRAVTAKRRRRAASKTRNNYNDDDDDDEDEDDDDEHLPWL